MITSKFSLSNLDCSHCASEIEKQVSGMSGVLNCRVNFMKKSIFIVTENPPDEDTLRKISEEIKKIEPEVELLKNQDKKDKKFFWDVVEIAVSAVIFVAGIFAGNYSYVWSMAVFVFAFLLCGYNIFLGGVKSLLKLKLNEKCLMTIAAVSAFAIGDFVEGFAVIFLFRVGSVLEQKAVNKSRNSIESLASIVPDKVTVLLDDGEVNISSSEVKKGDVICVKPFERVCTDGVILKGSTAFDTSAITGESLPVEKSEGDKILSGMINTTGMITMRAETCVEDSTAGRILKTIEDAGAQKSQTEGILARFSEIYTPVVIVLAILLCTVPLIFDVADFETLFRRSLVFLVSACPCAIVISIPLAFFIGIGKASKMGLIFKGGKYMESLSKSKAFVFDKTGTLTTGELKVDFVECYEGHSKDEVLKIAASVEAYSQHPMAGAITNYYTKEKYKIDEIKEYPGLGICALAGRNIMVCGKGELLEKMGYKIENLKEAPFYVTLNDKVIGLVTFFDTIKEQAKDTILGLKRLGANYTAVLSGDTKEETKRVASVCEIEEYFAKLLPEDKFEILQKIKKRYKNVTFVGDGINDTPSISFADCGVAMGKGSVAAMETADLVLMGEDIEKLPAAVRLSRKVMSVIKTNVAVTLAVKAIILILAALGLAPMWAAVLADTGLTLLAVVNSTRGIKIRD